MPLIPTYRSEAGIKPASLPEAGTGAISASKQAQGEVINAVANAEDTFIQIRDFRQKNEASAYTFERLNDIKSRADQDIDLDSSKYEKEIDQTGSDAAKNITGQLARESFMADFQKQATAVKWGIKNDFRTKELRAADATIDYQGQQIIDSYGSMDDASKAISVASYRKTLESGVAIGLYNQGTVDAKYAEFQKKVIKGSVDYGILNDPETTKAELKKGDEGAYPGLTQTERVNFIKESETRIEKLANQEKEAIAIATNKRESELIDAKIANTLTVPDVKKEREQGTISAQFADSMIKALESPKVFKPTALAGIIKYNELVERNATMAKKEGIMFNMGKVPFEDIAKFRADVINSNAKGYISDKQMSDLLGETSKTFYRDPVFQNALDQISSQSRLYATSDERARIKAEMYGNLITKVINGKNPREAVTEVIKEKMNTELGEAIKISEEGNRMFARKGNQRIYSEDGGITWKSEKTNEVIQ